MPESSILSARVPDVAERQTHITVTCMIEAHGTCLYSKTCPKCKRDNSPGLHTSAMFVCLLKIRINPACCTSDCIEQDGCSMRLVKNACLDSAVLTLQLHIHSSRCEADAGREEG